MTWASIAAGLEEALDFCRELGLGLHVERSRRFQAHRTCLAELARALSASRQTVARDIFDHTRMQAFTALTEGGELVATLPYLRTVPREIIGHKLATVLHGPLRSTDDDPNTNQARNVLFELTMASTLWRAGLAPELRNAGIRCVVNKRTIDVSCKRPFSRRGARQAYTDALEQLTIALREAPVGTRGLVALSITRFVNPGDRVFVHERETVGKTQLSAEMTRAAQWLMRPTRWPEPPEPMMGFLWHVITPGFDRSRNLLVAIQHMNVQPTRPGSADDVLLQALFGELRLLWDPRCRG